MKIEDAFEKKEIHSLTESITRKLDTAPNNI